MADTLKRVVLIGPESTGKSTLISQHAAHFQEPALPEYARHYYPLKNTSRTPPDGPDNAISVYEDITNVAIGQLYMEAALERLATRLMLLDTNPLVTLIFSEHYFQRKPDWLVAHCEATAYDLYLLTAPDLPWEADPLRDRPHQREQFFARFEEALQRRKAAYRIISGQGQQRLLRAIGAIDELLATG